MTEKIYHCVDENIYNFFIESVCDVIHQEKEIDKLKNTNNLLSTTLKRVCDEHNLDLIEEIKKDVIGHFSLKNIHLEE